MADEEDKSVLEEPIERRHITMEPLYYNRILWGS